MVFGDGPGYVSPHPILPLHSMTRVLGGSLMPKAFITACVQSVKPRRVLQALRVVLRVLRGALTEFESPRRPPDTPKAPRPRPKLSVASGDTLEPSWTPPDDTGATERFMGPVEVCPENENFGVRGRPRVCFTTAAFSPPIRWQLPWGAP